MSQQMNREESPLFDLELMQHLYDTSHEFRALCAQDAMYSGVQPMPPNQGIQPGFHQTVNGPYSGQQIDPRFPYVNVPSGRNVGAGQPFIGSQQPMNLNGSLPPNSLLFSPLTNQPIRDSPSTSQIVDNQPPRLLNGHRHIYNTTARSQRHQIGYCPFPNCAEPILYRWKIPEHLKEKHIRDGVQISSNSLRPYPKTGQFYCEVPECGGRVAMTKSAQHYKEHVERYFCPAPDCRYHAGRRDQLQRHVNIAHNDLSIDVNGISPAFITQY